MVIFLVGFMGAGKSTIGRKLSRRLGYRFLDTDAVIERDLGTPIEEVFRWQGEAYFRNLETELLQRLGFLKNAIISTGGGMPITPGNLEIMQSMGRVVYLKAEFEELMRRLRRDRSRPLLQTDDPEQTVRNLMEIREPIYMKADLVVETEGESPFRVATRIIRSL